MRWWVAVVAVGGVPIDVLTKAAPPFDVAALFDGLTIRSGYWATEVPVNGTVSAHEDFSPGLQLTGTDAALNVFRLSSLDARGGELDLHQGPVRLDDADQRDRRRASPTRACTRSATSTSASGTFVQLNDPENRPGLEGAPARDAVELPGGRRTSLCRRAWPGRAASSPRARCCRSAAATSTARWPSARSSGTRGRRTPTRPTRACRRRRPCPPMPPNPTPTPTATPTPAPSPTATPTPGAVPDSDADAGSDRLPRPRRRRERRSRASAWIARLVAPTPAWPAPRAAGSPRMLAPLGRWTGGPVGLLVLEARGEWVRVLRPRPPERPLRLAQRRPRAARPHAHAGRDRPVRAARHASCAPAGASGACAPSSALPPRPRRAAGSRSTSARASPTRAASSARSRCTSPRTPTCSTTTAAVRGASRSTGAGVRVCSTRWAPRPRTAASGSTTPASGISARVLAPGVPVAVAS